MLEVLQKVSAQMNPLPKHSLAVRVDKQTRQLYAVFLASLMADTGTVSRLHSEYFTSLLISLDIDADVGYYLERASRLDDQQVVDLIRLLDSDSAAALLFDALVLLRIDQPLSDSQGELLSAVADVFSMPENNVTLASFWALKALGIYTEDSQHSSLYEKAIKLAKKKRIKLITYKRFSFTVDSCSFVVAKQVIAKGYTQIEISSHKSHFHREAVPKEKKFTDFESGMSGFLVENIAPSSGNLAYYSIIPLPKYLDNWCSFYASAYA